MMISSAIQSVQIADYEERKEPTPHTVYRIIIGASVRQWTMWRRYSEFADLHVELAKATGAPPPAALPPKHTLSLFRARSNPALLSERRQGLETYLRAIISAKEDQWRECYVFKEFLGIPISKNVVVAQASAADPSSSSSSPASAFSLSSWLDEHRELQTCIRDVRAHINKRDALSDRADISGSHQANLQAKKSLLAVQTRIDSLERGLHALAGGGMSQGESQRRTEMVARLRDDCEKLTKMVTVARYTSRAATTGFQKYPANESDRAALLGTSPTTSFDKPVVRVFGAARQPKETEETRPLDDTGLFQLQQAKMDGQDANLEELATILQRQKHLGLAIGNEIGQQIELLDSLDNDVDKFGVKLSAAKKQLNKLG